jgi:hypothetical protein
MVTSEVQRTLVKSPPELWAELSDPAALARHLGDLGDVGNMRVTRVHAEERVDWEADSISGSVLMKASGWGTKVTLRVSREIAEVESESSIADAGEAPEDEQAPAQAVEAAAVDEAPPFESIMEPDEPQAPPIGPRRGFFSRLFRRRRPATQPELVEMAAASEVSVDEDQAMSASAAEAPSSPDPVAEEPVEPVAAEPPNLSADLKAAEEVAAEEVTAVLTATLDRLGAAHHRPFSRS